MIQAGFQGDFSFGHRFLIRIPAVSNDVSKFGFQVTTYKPPPHMPDKKYYDPLEKPRCRNRHQDVAQ
jgi:hypothetical protein